MDFITTSYSALCTILDGAGNRYSNLKKIIYQIEKDLVAAGADVESGISTQDQEPNEITRLLSPGARTAAKTLGNNTFISALDKELDKIVTFYYKKERELYAEVEALASDVQFVESIEHTFPIRAESSVGGHTRRSSIESSNNKRARSRRNSRASRRSTLGRTAGWSYDTALALANEASIQNTTRPSREAGNSTSRDPVLSGHEIASPSEITAINTDLRQDRIDDEDYDDDDEDITSLWFEPEMEESRIQFRHRVIEMYVNLNELQSFIRLNSTGFSKILKKYDKITENNTKKIYMNQVVLQAYPFKKETTAKLQEQIDRVTNIYARIFANGDVEVTKQTLKMHLREHMVWERNTIWRDMIGLERKSQAVAVSQSLNEDKAPLYLKTPIGILKVPSFLTQGSLVMALCSIIFIVLLYVDLFKELEQQNCFAILVFASMLWATEAMPLFVTSLLIPLLVVMLRVMRSDDDDHSRLNSSAAAKKIFSLMFSPVIMLLLGGFAIAAAMSKFHIAKAMATVVISKAGTRPGAMLLANMLVATVASMWISNVAAPVLCFSLIQVL
ncbi:low-affinity phosphate transporter [Mortierella sp. AM989]|nr:low-affinity phosphate transporter [Mortierella sp. AM989]